MSVCPQCGGPHTLDQCDDGAGLEVDPHGYEGIMSKIARHPFSCICDACAPDNYEKFCKLRDEMGKPSSPGGTYYPKYSEREAFELAVNFIVDDGK